MGKFHSELHCISVLNFNKYGKHRFWDEISLKIYEWLILQKIIHQNNQHIPMYPCIKFQSIWRTLDFTQICPKFYEWQNFEKLNIKNCNKHVTMYLFIKFKFILSTKFSQRLSMN